MPKFIEPMLSEHISGLATSGAASRCSTVMLRPPPVVMLMTASVACLMRGRNCMNTAGSGVGPAVLRIARVQMQDRGAGLGGRDRLRGDVVGRDRAARPTWSACECRR